MTEVIRIEEPLQPLALTVDDYRILADAGAFDERSRVELIEGVILTVSPQRRWHLRVKSELGWRLREQVQKLGLPLFVEIDGTVALSDTSAPDPDIILSADSPLDQYVAVSAVSLIVEVADTSLCFDLGRKLLLYARHGVPEYWVVSKKLVYRFWAPIDGDYAEKAESTLGEPISSATIPEISVETDGLI